jgi:thiol-disulfide isomerase/thioredoxin
MDEYSSKVSAFTITQFNQPRLFTKETDKELVECYYLFYSLIEDRKKQLPAPNAETTYRNAINYAKKITAEGSRNIMLRYLLTSITAQTTDTSFLKWMNSAIVFGKQNEHLKRMIAEKQDLLRKIGKDRSAPYFEATDVSGNKFSYKSYEGKYLFIDIWATWCVPCRKEIPYLEQLKQKYAGKSIEFISVSTDKNVNAWRRFVESADSKDQFHSVPGKISSINEVYQAVLIPAFVLIGPEGKIVNPASFRPSDPALSFLLDELLQKNNIQTIQ